MGILVLDIDHLKVINDDYGHDVGDKILVAVARAASGVLRGGDMLARTGGDEFLAVVADADEPIARLVADRITEAVSQGQGAGGPHVGQRGLCLLRQEQRPRPAAAAGGRGDVRGKARCTPAARPPPSEGCVDPGA